MNPMHAQTTVPMRHRVHGAVENAGVGSGDRPGSIKLLKTEEDMAKVSRKTALIVALMLAVTATVLVIGPAVQAANTDVSISDYSQCTDGTADDDFKACTGWINGILNAQNSTYHEDEVTPQRLLLKVPKGAVLAHSLDLTYLTRKGSAQAHAYDSLATWNFTQTDANRCQSLPNCPTGSSPSAVTDIPSDPTEVPPATSQGGDASTDVRELPQASRQLQFFGPVATVAAPGPITHDSAASPSTDDYATLTVNYVLDPSVDADNDGTVDATTYVQLVFGGHLAASGGLRSWGAGLGAANINGGPYHIRVTKIDGTAIGNRDNQITSGAILPLQTTVVTELHQTTDATGTTDVNPPIPGKTITANLDVAGTVFVKDVATVTSGATGSVDFFYYPSLTVCEADTTGAGTGGTAAGSDIAVNAQGTATSDVKSFTSSGTFYWRAFFTGTDISTPSSSPCDEILTIRQNTSTSTLLHETTNAAGTDFDPARTGKTLTVSPNAYVKDEATVSPSTATGSVAFKYYADTIVGGVTKTALANCTDDTNGTSVPTATFSGGTAFSNAVQFTTAGTFYWRAFFTDTTGLNNSSSSPCDEILTVQKASPTLATAPSLIPQDSATLAGILAGGTGATLTFELFKPTDTCADTDTPVFTQTVNVSGNGAYTTTNSGNPSGANDNTAFRLTAGSPTGIYKWKVVYSGDLFNNGTTSACGVESFNFQGITPPVVP